MAKRVVLAYSGGLDTSIAVRWLREEWGVEVVACAVDVGQLAHGEEETIRARAVAAGAVEVEVIDARAEFANDFLVPALRANALYEGKYPLVSALSRPVIVEHLVASPQQALALADLCGANPGYQLNSLDSIWISGAFASRDAIRRIHGWGAVALHDIANRRHAEKALEAGVDGVIAVAGGAGGHTGTINPFALMNEVRQLGDHFAVVLAGGQTTGRDVLAAEAMGWPAGSVRLEQDRFISTAGEASFDEVA